MWVQNCELSWLCNSDFTFIFNNVHQQSMLSNNNIWLPSLTRFSTLYNLCKNVYMSGFANKLIGATKNSEVPIIIDGILKLERSILSANENATVSKHTNLEAKCLLSLKRTHHEICPRTIITAAPRSS